MLTGNRLTRLWQTARYRHLMRELLTGRPEAGLGLDTRLGGPLAAAAVALVRLGELNQASTPLAREMLDRLLMAQGNSGGWRDPAGELCPMMSALCLRALMTLPGGGGLPASTLGMRSVGFDRPATPDLSQAILRGLGYLRDAQQEDGTWQRTDVSPLLATGFVLLQLGRTAAFRHAVDFESACRVGEAEQVEVTERALWASLQRRTGASGRGRLVGNAAPARSRFDRAGAGRQAKLGFAPLTSAA